MPEIFSTISPDEDAKLFSKKRAKRGAKIGAAAGGLLLGASAAIGFLVAPAKMAEEVVLQTTEILTYTGFISFTLGAVGAAIDSFRPTSRLFERDIKNKIETYRRIKENLSSLRDEVGYGGLLSKVLRPPIPDYMLEDKKSILGVSTLAGATTGFSAWGSAALDRALSRVIGLDHSSYTSQFLDAIANHPVEIVATGAALGFVGAAYVLVFHRPPNYLS